MDDNSVTLAGNLTADPKINVTSAGIAVTNFRIANTTRIRDKVTGEWRDGESIFISVTCWRTLAENVAASLKRGDRVVVKGRLKQHEYEATSGERKVSIDIEADLVGPELARATASPKRVVRENGARAEGVAAGAAGVAPDPSRADVEEAGMERAAQEPGESFAA